MGGPGEAVGINYVSADDKPLLIEHLAACGDQDYFERAIETAIALDGLRVRPLDISAFSAVEVDFESDLERANALFWGSSSVLPLAAEVRLAPRPGRRRAAPADVRAPGTGARPRSRPVPA